MSNGYGNGSKVPAGNSPDYHNAISQGLIPDRFMVHKFGAATLSTSIVPIAVGLNYQTPTTAKNIVIVSGATGDNGSGAGARKVEVQGLDENWNLQTGYVVPGGTSASLVLTAAGATAQFTRIFRVSVSESGTYATQSAGSHLGILDLYTEGTTALWARLPVSPFPVGQSEIGCYTIPKGYKGYLHSKSVFVNTAANKECDLYFFKRTNCDDITAPYTGTMRLVEKEIGLSGGFELSTEAPKYLGEGPCDIGFMGVATATSEVSVEFELEVVKA